jgi:hypothetical protein
MIAYKLYKHRGKILSLIVVMGAALYVTTQLHLGNGNPVEIQHLQNLPIGSYIQDQHLIDKETIIRTLQKKSEIVGLDEHFSRHITYTDSVFKETGWLKDAIGRRTLDITAEVFFKTGIDISELVKDDNIRVFGSTLHIKMPHETLISLNIPFDKMTFKETSGWIRSPLSLEEKQMLYTEIRKVVESNIMSDETIKNNTYEGVKSSLQLLLGKIKNVDQIIFSPRIE